MEVGHVTYFRTSAALRQWLRKHHKIADVLWIGFHKKDSGLPSITYPEALDEALCFGWIDGIRKKVNKDSYTIRFTQRRPDSIWSQVNIQKYRALEKAGKVRTAGKKAFLAMNKTRQYSYETNQKSLHPNMEVEFRKNSKAWNFFATQPPGYQRLATYWVMSAKQDTTRLRRLQTLIQDSAAGRRLRQLSRPS